MFGKAYHHFDRRGNARLPIARHTTQLCIASLQPYYSLFRFLSPICLQMCDLTVWNAITISFGDNFVVAYVNPLYLGVVLLPLHSQGFLPRKVHQPKYKLRILNVPYVGADDVCP